MVTYLEKAMDLMKAIHTVSIKIVSRSKNMNTDALAKLASIKDAELLEVVLVKFLAEPSIKQWPKEMELEHESSWMDPIVEYLKSGELPDNKTEGPKDKGSSLCHLRRITL